LSIRGVSKSVQLPIFNLLAQSIFCTKGDDEGKVISDYIFSRSDIHHACLDDPCSQ